MYASNIILTVNIFKRKRVSMTHVHKSSKLLRCIMHKPDSIIVFIKYAIYFFI